jgi:hypothetical protein
MISMDACLFASKANKQALAQDLRKDLPWQRDLGHVKRDGTTVANELRTRRVPRFRHLNA